MPHKETNPAALDARNDRRHFAIIALLCVFVMLCGAAVQAYRVHDAGWIPKFVSVTLPSHSNSYMNYLNEIHIDLYRDNQGLLYVPKTRPNSDASGFRIVIIERRFIHPLLNAPSRRGVTRIAKSSLHAYSTFRIGSIFTTQIRPASEAHEHAYFPFSKDLALAIWGPLGNWTELTEIQNPYPQDVLDALDAYFLQEYAKTRTRFDPAYADFPIVRHDGSDPALAATTRAPGVLPHGSLPTSIHRYTHNEFGTPESPLILADLIDGAKFALIYVAAPIILLDLIGYWGIYRMTGIRRRKLRKMRGECIRCGYPLIDGLCCECGLCVDVETEETAIP